MTLWELRQHMEEATPAWTILVAPVICVVGLIVFWVKGE